ncbi:hypothetical protein L6164_017480 [Bauhinia variegata]|uniref:Uncharacterized protein n=1 Tax=Bauhinia variegata TaxID=167791 RepID=A0ACB9N984_BAUVA|nr:hypothetical protein L6164_017480 [Bauhinia variegata]
MSKRSHYQSKIKRYSCSGRAGAQAFCFLCCSLQTFLNINALNCVSLGEFPKHITQENKGTLNILLAIWTESFYSSSVFLFLRSEKTKKFGCWKKSSGLSAASPPQVPTVTSAHYRSPSLDLLQDTRESREKYLTLCVPLYKFALKGDWPGAKRLLDVNTKLLNAAIAKGWPTLLHVAAGANHADFVEELVKLMDKEDLELQDCKNNTAFCFAAANGNIPIAKIMLEKNPDLVGIRGGNGMAPVHFAALQGKSEMARYLYSKTVEMFDDGDWDMLFFDCIYTGIDDLALKMLKERPTLALALDENKETALHILARNPLGFGCEIAEHTNHYMNSGVILKQARVLQIVDCLWNNILKLKDSDSEVKETISTPSHVLFEAVGAGNFEFLAKLLSYCPDLIWELDTRNRSIIHFAVLHRQSDIFNLIHEIGSNKDIIISYVDPEDGNNLLHLAAKLAPTDQLEMISGAAFQMRLELLWFEKVKKIMPPSYIRMKNSKGMTPQELFTEEHKELLEKARTWMKETANSCTVVSTLITTGVFSAAYSLPGGTNDNSGNPNYLGKTPFQIFSIADAIAMIFSSTSVLIFLSILVSRYAQHDFYKSLPSKLIYGMVALFISITTMMIAFSSAFFVSYYHGTKWVPSSISVIAALPALVFVCLQYSLWSDIIYSIYFCHSLFLPSKHMLS